MRHWRRRLQKRRINPFGGIVCDDERIFEIVERKNDQFTPLDVHSNPLEALSSRIQNAASRVAVACDAARVLGAS